MIFRSVCVILFFNVCWNFFLIFATYRNNIIVIYILNINDKIFVNRKESFRDKSNVHCNANTTSDNLSLFLYRIFNKKKNKTSILKKN